MKDVLSEPILRYLIDEELPAESETRPVKLPAMGTLARQLGVSKGKLREDLIAAEAYGIVEMRPGDGTYVCPFDFYAAIAPPLLYSVACDGRNFDHFYKLRAHLEVAFWDEAVTRLGASHLERMRRLLRRADRKLASLPVEIPYREHRELHLLIYSELNNPFVQGLLKAYWDAYEAVGLHRFHDMDYYERMWKSHRVMVEAIAESDVEAGKQAMIGHFAILESRLHPPNATDG